MDKSPPIHALTTAVADNGRRGQPRGGCDCVQCFGYCLIDSEESRRIALEKMLGKHDGSNLAQ